MVSSPVDGLETRFPTVMYIGHMRTFADDAVTYIILISFTYEL